MHHIARCCQPIPGDAIVGYITNGTVVFLFTERIGTILDLQRLIQNAWWNQFGAKITPVVSILISVLWQAIAMAYYVILRRFWQMKKLAC